ncbi:hypothetical protein D1872_132920 [compost metagenome]
MKELEIKTGRRIEDIRAGLQALERDNYILWGIRPFCEILSFWRAGSVDRVDLCPQVMQIGISQNIKTPDCSGVVFYLIEYS